MPPRPPGGALPLWRWKSLRQLAPKRRYGTAPAGAAKSSTCDFTEPQKATAVQLLRFALSGSARPPEAKHDDPKFDNFLKFVFTSPFLTRQHKAILPTSPSSTPFNLPMADDGVVSLSEISIAIEKQVNSREDALGMMDSLPMIQAALSRCHNHVQYEELLALVNAMSTRARAFEVKPSQQLLLLGIFYASVCSSPSALQHYIAQYVEAGYGPLNNEAATNTLRHLISALQSQIREDSALRKKQLREVVSGSSVDGRDPPVSLRSILDISTDALESELLCDYVTLVGLLGATDQLSRIFASTLAQLRSSRTPGLLRAAGQCLQGFIDAGDGQQAVKAAKDISLIVDLNELIPISLWKSLLEHDHSGILQDIPNQRTAESVLKNELRLIETNLGAAAWDVDHHLHANGATTELNEELDELKVYDELGLGENSMFIVASRLLGITIANGSSENTSSLSKIANVLNEYEGTEIRLGINEELRQEYAWFPHCSPVEFTGFETPLGFNETAAWSPASLGLIRARPDCDGVPLKSGRHIHLIQLGYIAARESSLAEQENTTHDEPWTPTGHIIGWDRLHKCFVLLCAGKAIGTIAPGLSQPRLPSSLPYLSATIDVVEKDGVSTLNVDSIRPLGNAKAYWLDVDPGFDLQS
ncbi:hypothetical protein VTO42DRAFT_345 [Malbranchea cinnamomea]